jgi:hypothetical protein
MAELWLVFSQWLLEAFPFFTDCDLSDIMAFALTHIVAVADRQKRLYTDGLAILL